MNLGKESETVEFKESTGELKEGVRSLVAMLNKSGQGTLYFGVKNNGDVIGQQSGERTLRDISQAISTNIEPAVIPTIEEISIPDSKLKAIKVMASGVDIPYSAYGSYLIRSADEDRKITRAALKAMFQGSGADLITEMKSPNQELSFEQFVSLLTAKGYHVTSLQSLTKSKGLVNSEGEYNLMSFILSDQSDVSIKVVRFSGLDKTSMAQRNEFGGKCLLVSLQQAMDYVESLNETNVVLGHGARRETPLFDNEAFEEAWKNACVHNSWADMVPPAVYVFSDRLEIVSYGGLPFGLKLEEFYKGFSRPINRALWSIFNSADYAEQTGHGVTTIVSRYGENAFEITDNFITVRIPFAFRPTWANVSEAGDLRKALNKTQIKLFEAIKENPNATSSELADATGISESTIKKNTAKLVKLGAIQRSGSRKKGYWIVKEGGTKDGI